MRVFVAIELNDIIKSQLSAIQEKVRSESVKGKYSDIDNFHLTLHFIGEVSEDRCEEIKSALIRVAENTAAFELSVDHLGNFPKKQKHIIWMGVKGDVDPLYRLNQKIREELKGTQSADEDQKYTPHITLGRQVVLNQTFDDLQEKIQEPELFLSVQSLSLMESRREDGKLVYQPIFNKMLGAGKNDR